MEAGAINRTNEETPGNRIPGWDHEGESLRTKARAAKICANCGKAIKHPSVYYCRDSNCSREFYMKHHPGQWPELRKKIAEVAEYKCARCGKKTGSYFEIDHIKEVAVGGKTELSNLQLLCSDCHRMKTTSFLRKRFRKEPNPPIVRIKFEIEQEQLFP